MRIQSINISYLHAGSARYAREFSLARCYDVAGAIILHGNAVANDAQHIPDLMVNIFSRK